MSTILDALRKVEQDHRAQNTDVRARLLTLPPRPHARAPQKKLPSWIMMSLGLTMIGCLLGAGIIMYRPSPILTWMTVESAGSSGSLPSTQTVKAIIRLSPDKLAASPMTANRLPAQPTAKPSTDPFVPIPTRQKQSAPVVANMQHSPFRFAASSGSSESASAERPNTPTASPMTSQAGYVIEPLPPHFWDNGNEAISREDEAHFVSPSPESVSLPAPVPLVASLSLLQWSPETAERFVSIKIGDGPLTMVYEGDSVGGFTIVKIHKNKVDLRSNDADRTGRTLHLR